QPHGIRNTYGIPVFKGTEFPAETSFQSIVYFIKFVCDLRNPVGNVLEQSRKGRTVEFSCLVLSCYEHLDALLQVVYRTGHFKRRKFYLLLRLVLKCLQIERKDLRLAFLVLCLFVKSLSRFISKPFVLCHLFKILGKCEQVVRLVLRYIPFQAIRNV